MEVELDTYWHEDHESFLEEEGQEVSGALEVMVDLKALLKSWSAQIAEVVVGMNEVVTVEHGWNDVV